MIVIIITLLLQESCLSEESICPETYFDNVRNSPLSNRTSMVCQPCHSECLSCNGILSTDCQSCRSSFTTISPTGGDITECLPSCSQSPDPSLCQTCDPQCNGCSGLTNQDCDSCNEDSIMLNGVLTCVPSCGPGQYLSRVSNTGTEHNCRPCNTQCQNCTGPTNTECLQCTRVNSTINGVTTCMENCPADMFVSSTVTRLCQPCDRQCSGGCSGPSNKNCSFCVENTIQDGNGIVCNPFCPTGMEYDDGCKLTM